MSESKEPIDVAGMTDAELIARWDAVEGEPNADDLLVLDEIQRRDLDL